VASELNINFGLAKQADNTHAVVLTFMSGSLNVAVMANPDAIDQILEALNIGLPQARDAAKRANMGLILPTMPNINFENLKGGNNDQDPS
jgi:hypothetical protein